MDFCRLLKIWVKILVILYSSTYSQKLLNHATDAFKTAPEKAIHKSAQATGDLIGNKIAYRITNISKNPQQNNSETRHK